MKKTALLILALLAGCGGGGATPGQDAKPDAPVPIKVTTGVVQTATLPNTVDIIGTLQADARTTIASEASGRVVRVVADLGDRLGPGQPLAYLDDTDYTLATSQQQATLNEALARLGLSALPDDSFDVASVATVQRAELQAENARSKFVRAQTLFQQSPPLISEQEFADLQTAAEVAARDADVALLEARSLLAMAHTRAREVEIAQENLADTVLRTPAEGDETRDSDAEPQYAVARRMVTVGQLVSNGQATFELVVDDPLRFSGAVPERAAFDIQLGQRVELTIAGSDTPVIGQISRIDPTVDTGSRTFLIEATVQNADRSIRPGTFARASVQVGQRMAFRVPAEALFSFAGTDKVFLLQDGKASERRVRLIGREDKTILLEGDLADGQAVITSPVSEMSNGAAATSQ